MTEQMEGQLSFCDLDIWSGKTSPEPSAATKAKTSALSSKKRQKSQKKTPLFLNLIGGGQAQDASWETGGLLPGAYTMRSFGESPSEESGSHLSQILEDRPHQKYSLSARACQGILNRAKRRGKKLPEALKAALEAQASIAFMETELTEPTQPDAMQAFGTYKECGVASGLKSRDYKDATDLVVAAVDCRNGTENQDINGTLQAKEQGQNLNSNNVLRIGSLVRRLTPLECERLQGYPDHWTDIGEWTDTKGKKHKDADTPRYKALGNSIALPFWQWLARRICAQYIKPVHMGSLFDGIGGFPLVFERAGGVPVWASEIEEFAIAVTKKHFKEV